MFVDCIGSVPQRSDSGLYNRLDREFFIRSLQGFVPGMFGVIHGALQFMTYEEMKEFYNRYRGVPFDSKLVII